MAKMIEQHEGGYVAVPGVFQYSAGVAAAPGCEIVHVTFRERPTIDEGFAKIRRYLEAIDRPTTAFCACELRSPAPFTEAGFREFNERYVGNLAAFGLFADGVNPVARSNVCPELDPPDEPTFHAFAYTVRSTTATAFPTWVVAGSGEVPEGRDNYRDHIVAPGDTSAAGLRAKAEFVTGEMRRRIEALGQRVSAVTAAQVYTVKPIDGLMELLAGRDGLGRRGLTWQYCRPPIVGLDFEMDCRCVRQELVL